MSACRAAVVCLVAACPAARAAGPERDHHSFATPEHVRVRHLDLDLDVRFDDRVIRGTATLAVERTWADTTRPLVLDTRGLAVESAEASADGKAFARTEFDLGKEDPILGRPLTVKLPAAVKVVRIKYATG